MTPALRSSLEEEREKELLQGIQKGRTEGKMAEKQAMIARMLQEKMQISIISEVTGLSVDEINKFKNRS